MTVENALNILRLHKEAGNTIAYDNMLQHLREDRGLTDEELGLAPKPEPKKKAKKSK